VRKSLTIGQSYGRENAAIIRVANSKLTVAAIARRVNLAVRIKRQRVHPSRRDRYDFSVAKRRNKRPSIETTADIRQT
jgi:hypothetical protein